jgi:hypothetical protein
MFLAGSSKLGDFAIVQKGFEFKAEAELKGRVVESVHRTSGWVQGFSRADGGFQIWQQPEMAWFDYQDKWLRRIGAPHKPGTAQVLINYAPSVPGPWLIKATLDPDGRPVTSRFVAVRRKEQSPPLEFFWAVINSPVANAFAASWPDKRQTLVKDWRTLSLPVPSSERSSAIVQAARDYLKLMRDGDGFMKIAPSQDTVRAALLRLDAEVLRLYDLPPRLERQLLDFFGIAERKGSPCNFGGYYPAGMEAFVPLHELLSAEYARSTLGRFREQHKPTRDPNLLAALRSAAETFSEE